MDSDACASRCGDESASVEALNRDCFCLSLDQARLRDELEAAIEIRGLARAMIDTHPHLFSSLPLYVARRHIDQMASVVSAIEQVVATQQYLSAVLSWAPEIAAFDPGSPGGLLGFDFHLGPDGPQLIEINTNPGGALLNAILGKVQRSCCPTLIMPPTDALAVEERLLDLFAKEWRSQRGNASLRSIAIVDESPQQQYLHPEFLLFRQMFRRSGIEAVICDPNELAHRDGKLWHAAQPIDLVYNRLTDFGFAEPAQSSLKTAYLSRDVAVSPHPRSHAIYADKRNLTLLCDAEFLASTGVSGTAIKTLLDAVPNTRIVSQDNREALWADRRHFFFKPAAGYGSKASYRGAKITKRVWEEIAKGAYVAQAFVVPGERRVSGDLSALKADIRCYAYKGEVLQFAARLYQGQTTNFRTPGGGFAPVLTSAAESPVHR
jgi:hypothetical protein